MLPTPLSAPEHAAGPVLTPELVTATERAWERGVAAAAADARRALAVDVSTPFASLDDAIERLLPFHVFGTMEGDEMDEEEAGASSAPSTPARSLTPLAPQSSPAAG